METAYRVVWSQPGFCYLYHAGRIFGDFFIYTYTSQRYSTHKQQPFYVVGSLHVHGRGGSFLEFDRSGRSIAAMASAATYHATRDYGWVVDLLLEAGAVFPDPLPDEPPPDYGPSRDTP